MPELNSDLHLEMLRSGRRKRTAIGKLRWAMKTLRKPSELPCDSFSHRAKKAIRILTSRRPAYGLEWGDPEVDPSLTYVRDRFLLPYVRPESVVVEVGPGGGRWTRYLLGARRVYAVDYHAELLEELRSQFPQDHLVCIKNDGADFPGVPEGSIDFLFSFGVFVHLEPELIEAYIGEMRRILGPRAVVVLQYSDDTKPASRNNPGFSSNSPDRMRRLLTASGFRIDEEDTETFDFCSIVRFGP